jgi:hypothetical protein
LTESFDGFLSSATALVTAVASLAIVSDRRTVLAKAGVPVAGTDSIAGVGFVAFMMSLGKE